MGWLYLEAEDGDEKDLVEFAKREIISEEYDIVHSHIHGCNCERKVEGYFAIDDGSEVMGLVILFDVKGSRIGYKLMDESVGPCYHNCPIELIEKLAPTNHKYAKKWREKCIEHSKSYPHIVPNN